MADQNLSEGSSKSSMHSEMTDSTMEINIKTLDSQIYRFNADKDMRVSAFKEKIATQIGVPMEQQRLIFRGKVLKDTHLLSEYHLENGDTLHLVARQPSQAQSSSSSSTGDATANNIGMGTEPGVGAPRGRIGQISHSVVVGTFNAGEQDEGGPPDLNRVIGAVLNSIGLGNQAGMTPNVLFNSHIQNPQRTEVDGRRNGAGSQSQGGNQSHAGNPLSGSLPQIMQIPLGAAIAIPSFSMPIPDSLHTLCEFMSRMEIALSRRAGIQPSQSSDATFNVPGVELPTNHGVPTPNALALVIRQAQRLISGPAMGSLSHIAGRLEQEAGSSDPSIRADMQSESVQVGLSMQHLGALLLELGRTILTLRMGQSPVESSVNAGPAVYISPTGPNPIMVQPFPLQTSSLFPNPAANMINPVASGSIGVGSIPRHVNIHIHTGASIAPIVPGVGPGTTTGEAGQGEHVGRTVSGDSGQSQALPVGNFSANAVPPGPTVIAVSGTGVDALQPHPPSLSPEIHTFAGNTRTEQLASSGRSESLTIQGQSIGSAAGDDDSIPQNISSSEGVVDTNLSTSSSSRIEDHEQAQLEADKPHPEKDFGMSMKSVSEPSSSSNGAGFSKLEKPQVRSQEGASGSPEGMSIPDKSSNVPLGLGLGGLQPKRRGRRPTLQEKSSEGSTDPSRAQQHTLIGQQVLQSLASLSSGSNSNANATAELPYLNEANTHSFPTSLSTGDQNDDGQLDVSDALSQALQSPALSGLLAGVSNQTGIGSPNSLRNMLEQMTQSPALRNTVNQIAQQIDNHDLENMFSGLGGNQGGGFDLSRMVQQMMPIVSQALGGVSAGVPPDPEMGVSGVESGSTREVESFPENSQLEPQDLARRIERQSSPGRIFSSVVRSVSEFYGHDDGADGLLNELCSEAGLARDFVDMLRHDISQRLQDETGP